MKKIRILKETPGKVLYAIKLVDGTILLPLMKTKHFKLINCINRHIYISPEMTMNDFGRTLLANSNIQYYGTKGVYTGIDYLISLGGTKQ